jgi:hypothetical protein
MCICVLTRQTTKLVCLHYCDEASAELKVSVASVDNGPNGHIGNSRDGVAMECLGHGRSSEWCGGRWFNCR